MLLYAVGSTLAAGALRRQADRLDLTLLGAGSAAGLALNDLASLDELPEIYRADLAYEIGLVCAWLATARRSRA